MRESCLALPWHGVHRVAQQIDRFQSTHFVTPDLPALTGLATRRKAPTLQIAIRARARAAEQSIETFSVGI